MPTYVILSRLGSDAVPDGDTLRRRAEKVATRIKTECPGVSWKDSYALMGRYDVLDIFDAPGPTDAERAATIIRADGHARTETMPATPWKEFLSAI